MGCLVDKGSLLFSLICRTRKGHLIPIGVRDLEGDREVILRNENGEVSCCVRCAALVGERPSGCFVRLSCGCGRG